MITKEFREVWESVVVKLHDHLQKIDKDHAEVLRQVDYWKAATSRAEAVSGNPTPPARTIKEIEARLRQAEDSAEHWKSVAAEKSMEVARWKAIAEKWEKQIIYWKSVAGSPNPKDFERLQAQLENCKENCDRSERDLEISRKRVEDLEMRLEDAERELKATTDNVREFEKESGVWTEQRNFWTLCARVQALIQSNKTLYKELREANARTEEPPRMGVGPTASQYVDSTAGVKAYCMWTYEKHSWQPSCMSIRCFFNEPHRRCPIAESS